MNKVNVPRVLLGFNYLVSRLWLVCIILLVLLTVSVAVSIWQKDLAWLSAFGGVMTIFGILLTVGHSVPKTSDEITAFIETKFPESRDGILPNVSSERDDESIKSKRKEEVNRVLKSEAIGLIMSIVGTLMWAYISFLNHIFWPATYQVIMKWS